MKLNPDNSKSPEQLAWERGYAQGLANAAPAAPTSETSNPAPEPDLQREIDARKAAQIENEALKARIARARLDLMDELKKQGWAPAAPAPAEPLTDEQIEGGRSKLFSVGNPFCPITEKAMRTAVRWAERCHGIVASKGEQA